MELSNSVKKRFLKDWSIPFQVVQEPFWNYAIDEINLVYDTKSNVQLLEETIKKLGTEEEFFSEGHRIKYDLINSIKSTKTYQKLGQDKLNDYKIQNKVKQQNIYTVDNTNKTFISLDLKKANFNVFKYYNPELVLNFETYEDLIGSVTDLEYFKGSKYLRQVIFGNLLPKKQQLLQKFVIGKLVEFLSNEMNIQIEDILSSSSDEVVFVVGENDAEQIVQSIKNKLHQIEDVKEFASWVHVETFKLVQVENKPYFVKEFPSDKVEFKGIPSFLFMQVYKKYFNKEEIDLDRVFYHEGFLARFEQGVFDDV